VEVDFIIEASRRRAGGPAEIIAIEVKRGEKWNREWETPLRSLDKFRGVRLKKRIGVYTGRRSYLFDGVEILPVDEFFNALHDGRIF
jgi:hypothetical protein